MNPFLNRDGLNPKGRVEIFHTQGAPRVALGDLVDRKLPPHSPKIYKSAELDFSDCNILSTEDIHNIIVNLGKDKVIQALTSGFVNQIMRMAIGDRGTIPSDPTQPKVPTANLTTLYNEIFRSDIDTFVEDTGGLVHEVKFIKTFSAANIPLTAFSNQASPVVNEIGLIMADAITGAPFPRSDIASPNTPNADESLFSLRTFKSVPFEAANDISITIRYTIYIE